MQWKLSLFRINCHYIWVTSLSFLPKSRLPAIKVKYLLLVWLGILITSWVLYMQYASYSELCRGHVCHMIIVSMVKLQYESRKTNDYV